MSWYTYILECADCSYYVGITSDPKKRLALHNTGQAAVWTKMRRPVKYRYIEGCRSKSEARRRELELKGWRREKKEGLFSSPDNLLKADMFDQL
ncbi:MAG: GIY-YIG nuclease family protein [Verrucomicrobia bacterium]|nr:GIY-YIG nuclease family protein [Verrucomicrobiota bacterium]